ncbi:hypothetical protein TNCV_3658431 [Trichonephila clavipes]|nr:hypothetical protein TNCV_3658431 [Trichonephila clavipes]
MEAVTVLCSYGSITKVDNQNHESLLAGISRRPDGTGISNSDEYVTEDLININPDKSADPFVKGILRAGS